MSTEDLDIRLYQYLISIYNIDQSSYVRRDHFISEYDELNENSIMHILFSKFGFNKQDINQENEADYLDYILDSNKNFIQYYNNANKYPSNRTIFYMDNMNAIRTNLDIVEQKPYSNSKIIDFDISEFASNAVKYYLVYLDIISQLYRYAFELKKNGDSFRASTFKLQGRYHQMIDNVTIQLFSEYQYLSNSSSFFDLDINVMYEGADNKIINIRCSSERIICGVFDVFKNDIIRHLNYLSGDDVKMTSLSYLKTAEYFYKFCRLRLMYLVAYSIQQLPLNDIVGADLTAASTTKQNMETYILQDIMAVFSNFKSTLDIEIMQNEDLKNSKNMLYNKGVINSSAKLGKINQEINDNKQKLQANKSLSEYMDIEFNKIYMAHLNATVLLFVVIFLSICIFFLNIPNEYKAMFSLIMSVIVVSLIVVLYIVDIEYYKKEGFEFEVESRRYPQIKLISSSDPLDVLASDHADDAYKIFNDPNGNESGWNTAEDKYDINGSALKSYSTSHYINNYKGEYIIIDLREYIILDFFTIKIDVSQLNSSPKDFRIYGAEVLPSETSKSTYEWVYLPHTNNGSYNGDGIMNATINQKSSKPYRYYMIIINKLMGPSRKAHIKYWSLYGFKTTETKELKDIITITNPTRLPIDQQLDAIALPSDYDDSRLYKWDLTINTVSNKMGSDSGPFFGFGSSSGATQDAASLDLSIGTFALKQDETKILNQKGPLDPFGLGYIVGSINSPKSLTSISYTLNISYYPSKNTIDIEQQDLLYKLQGSTLSSKLDDSSNLLKGYIQDYIDTSNLTVAHSNMIDFYNRQILLYDAIYQSCNTDQRNATLHSNLLIAYNQSNMILQGLLSTSNSQMIILNESIRNVNENWRIYTQNSNINVRLNQSFIKIRESAAASMMKFQSFILAYNINNDLFSGNQANIDSMVYQLEQALDQEKKHLYTCNLELLNAFELPDYNEIEDLRAAARLQNLDASDIEFQNSLRNGLIQGKQLMNSQFESDLQAAIQQRDNQKSAASQANTNRINEESKAAIKLQEYNQKYGTNYASLDDLGNYLQNRIDSAKSADSTARSDYAELQYQDTVAKNKYDTANRLILYYNALADETNNSIIAYRQIESATKSQLRSIRSTRDRLQGLITTKRNTADTEISDAFDKYKNALQKFDDVAALKMRRLELVNDIAYQRRRRTEQTQAGIKAAADKDKVYNELQALISKKELIEKEKNYYNSLRTQLQSDVDATIVIKDIEMAIQYNINDNMNGINYELINPNIASELHYFDKYKNQMHLSVSESEFDLNNKILGIKDMQARTVLFFNLSLIICISMSVFYYISSDIAAAICIISVILSIVIYSVTIRYPVRNRGKTYYFG